MAETKTATYKRYNGKDWDTIYFATSASQVGESSSRFFIKPGSNTVNGKQFTENGGITLYSTDIKLSSSDETTVKDAIAQAMSAIPTGVLTTANYATTLDSVYEKKSDATSAHNTITNKIDNLTTAVNNRYTKTESDGKYQPKGTYATLGTDGKVPSSQLPSYVDDVIEGYYSNGKFYSDSAKTKEITGEGGKIYTDLTSNKTYRWGGTAWVEISASLAIGETAGTAYDGASGKKNADDIFTLFGNINDIADGNVNVGYAKDSGMLGETPPSGYVKQIKVGSTTYNPTNSVITLGNYASSDHTHTFASLTSKPTTLNGYGITDAYTKTEADGKYVTIDTEQDITGSKILANNVVFKSTPNFQSGSIKFGTGVTSAPFTVFNSYDNGESYFKWYNSSGDVSYTLFMPGIIYGKADRIVTESFVDTEISDRAYTKTESDAKYQPKGNYASTADLSNRATKIYFEDTVPTSGMVAGDICIEY